MKVSLIAAIGNKRQIGKDNQLLWHISEDLKNFKKVTLDKTILMGRKTFESIGRPLPRRKNIVLTRNKDLKIEGVEVVHSLDDLVQRTDLGQELMVIGGEQVYRLALGHASRIYLSRVDYNGEADTFFPEFSEKEWVLSELTSFPELNGSPKWEFQVWERVEN